MMDDGHTAASTHLLMKPIPSASGVMSQSKTVGTVGGGIGNNGGGGNGSLMKTVGALGGQIVRKV
jgi:hypothetical protein